MSLRKSFWRKHSRINNNKVKLHRINLIASSHKQINHQYNKCYKRHVLRSSRSSCSSLRLGILPLPNLEIHSQPTLDELPGVLSHSIFLRPRILASSRSGVHNQLTSCELLGVITRSYYRSHLLVSFHHYKSKG